MKDEEACLSDIFVKVLSGNTATLRDAEYELLDSSLAHVSTCTLGRYVKKYYAEKADDDVGQAFRTRLERVLNEVRRARKAA